MRQALQISHLSYDVEEVLPDGLDTVVGERGITLSGGQKQRVALARALMTDPRILILDDSLSSIDTATERAILQQLSVVMKERTTLLVTHRFNALDLVDKVVVLDEGRIVAEGSHSQLVEQGGFYAEMVERQRLREELESR